MIRTYRFKQKSLNLISQWPDSTYCLPSIKKGEMKFEQLEKEIRLLVSQNKLREAINLLNDFFTEDDDLDDITIQSSNYYSVLEKEVRGTADALEVELVLNKLRSNILQLLRSKKEYIRYKEQTFGETSHPDKIDTEEIKVFFSVGSPHNDEQQVYINELVAYFKSNGIKLETLKNWNDNDPILPIINELKASNGCFVLALERYFVSEGTEKRGSDQESKILDKSFTSPWLHIEAAIARSLDLPLIIFKAYTNRPNLGSGLNEIEGSSKSEFRAQLRIQF